MAKYENAYEPDSSYGSAVRLVESSSVREGVALDMGCGYAAVAELLERLGLTYVGIDVDPVAVADCVARGLDAAVVDLGGSRSALAEAISTLLNGRELGVVLALDSLEHLVEPEAVLDVVRGLSRDGRAVPLIVSYPNVTHFDVGANLLSGRWVRTDEGLLDRTHLQFRDVDGLTAMMTATGWREDAVDDVIRTHSDQAVPSDSPLLRPGSPLRELLWRTRADSSPTGTVFQFVRRYVPDTPTPVDERLVLDEERPLLGVVVVLAPGCSPADAEPLLADLAAQMPVVTDVEVVGSDQVDEALQRRQGRWLAVLDARTRLRADWAEMLESMAEVGAGRILRVGVVALDDDAWAEMNPAPLDLGPLADEHGTVELDSLDPVAGAPAGLVVPEAYLIPLELVRTTGLVPGKPAPLGAERVAWLARAAQLSGVLGTPIPAVAVARSRVMTPDALADLVTGILDDAPMVLPAGSAARLVELRRRATDADGVVADAVSARHLAEEREARMVEQLLRLDHDLEVERAELEKLRKEHASRVSRRLARAVQRLRARLR